MSPAERLTPRFQSLDLLRGMAALWVFTYHYDFSESSRHALAWLMPLFQVGHLGVPMFFVISGYCLMASVRRAWRDGESTRHFLYRRFLRIYPPYWLSILIVATLPFAIEALSAAKTGTFVAPRAEVSANYGFLHYGAADWLRVFSLTQVFARVPGATTLSAKFSAINAVYWTLAIEFQFYLVMAAALALRSRWAAWLGGVTLVSLPLWYLGTWDATGVFLPYWPMFAVGIALYLFLERGLSGSTVLGDRRTVAAAVVIGLLCAGFVAETLAGSEVGSLSFALGFGVFLWLLHAFDMRLVRTSQGRRSVTRVVIRAGGYVGVMSYSLYLLHGQLQLLAMQVSRQVLTPGLLFDVAAIVFTCAMCYAFYLACERPFIRSRTRPATVPASVAPHRDAVGVPAS